MEPSWTTPRLTTERFGNQQGTIHGGFLTELADAAIGTAWSRFGPGNIDFTRIEMGPPREQIKPDQEKAWSGSAGTLS